MATLSPSLLNDADTCLKRLEFKRTDQEYRSGDIRATGNGYHKGLEAYYSVGASRSEILLAAYTEFDAEVERCGEHFKWQETLEVAHERMTNMLTAYFEDGHYWPSTYEVLATEYEYTHAVGETWAEHGFIDLLLKDPNGWIVIVDHKSAGKMWADSKAEARKLNQPALYTKAIQEDFGTDQTIFCYDVMTYAGKFKRFQSIATPEIVAAVKQKQLIIGGLFYSDMPLPGNPSSNLCSSKFCDFWDICPHGAVLSVSSTAPGAV